MRKFKVLVARFLATLLVVLAIAVAAEAQINCGGIMWISNSGCSLLSYGDKNRAPSCKDATCAPTSGICTSASGGQHNTVRFDFLTSTYCDCVPTTSGDCNDGATNICGWRKYYHDATCTLAHCPNATWYTCGCTMSGC